MSARPLLSSTTLALRRSLKRWMLSHPFLLVVALLLPLEWALAQGSANHDPKHDRSLSYTNCVDPRIPWSAHVVRVDLARSELRLCTTLGQGDVLGMGILSDQVKTLPSSLGQPLAAINGDFFDKAKNYPGRPRDIQIRQGEVVSHPTGHSCFWIGPEGLPHMTNIHSRFRVVWPDGKSTPFALNAQRTNDAAVLYTAVLGPSTLTTGGLEYVLERVPGQAWLPLRAGEAYESRVRSVRTTGNTPLDRETVVFSIGPALVGSVPALKPGDTLRFYTETTPNLAGVEIAIGGGPGLLSDRKVMSWAGWVPLRHPRTAIGWNKEALFLVEVDGRQIDVSLGMTFPELADFMLKLGCDHAMNFDGGGSATLWAFGSVRSSPSEGQERPAPNALVVVRKQARSDTK